MDSELRFLVVVACISILLFIVIRALISLTIYANNSSGGPERILRKRVFKDKEEVRAELTEYFSHINRYLYKATFSFGTAIFLIALMLKMAIPGISVVGVVTILIIFLISPVSIFSCIFYIVRSMQKEIMEKFNED